MADTVRTLAAILTLLADNSTGAISEQDLRDAVVSLWQGHLGTTHDMASDANYTLSDTQNASALIEITDTAPAQLTTGRDIVVSAIVRPFFFLNSTAQTLTVKVTGQTGVAVAASQMRLLRCNGTDVVDVNLAIDSIPDAVNIELGSTTGTKLGTATTQKLGLWNATPIVQPSGANQAALTDSTGGTADGTLEAVGATNAGDVSGAINNNFKELFVKINEIRTVLVSTGIMKGSA